MDPHLHPNNHQIIHEVIKTQLKDKNATCTPNLKKRIYSLLQGGNISNKNLVNHLEPHGYKTIYITVSLWMNNRVPIIFNMVLHDFDAKNQENTKPYT